MKSAHPHASDILDLKNISFAMAEDLHRAGIDTPTALRRTGAESAWLAARKSGLHEHSIQSLLALEGAISNLTWMNVPTDRRAELVRFAASVFAGAALPVTARA
jgi:DNA transformation protein